MLSWYILSYFRYSTREALLYTSETSPFSHRSTLLHYYIFLEKGVEWNLIGRCQHIVHKNTAQISCANKHFDYDYTPLPKRATAVKSTKAKVAKVV